MRGTTNMSQVKEQGKFTALPEGEYEVEIIEVNDKTSTNGDPMASIKLMIKAGPFQDDAWVWDNILIPSLNSPAAKILSRTKHFLHAIGEPYEGEEVEYDTARWKYKLCRIKVEIEPANQYHKFPKPIVAEYLTDEDAPQVEDDPFSK